MKNYARKSLLVLTILAAFCLMASSVYAQRISMGDFSSQAVKINFDELPDDFLIGDHYLSLGVSLPDAVTVHRDYGTPSLPNNIVSSSTNHNATPGTSPIHINFPHGVTQAGIQIDNDGYNLDRQPYIQFFDMTGNLLVTQNFAQGPDFVGFQFPGNLIGRLVIGSVLPGGTIGSSDAYDNLIFTPSTVPEPGALALFGAGLIGGFLILCRQRKSITKCSSRFNFRNFEGVLQARTGT